MLIIAIWKAKVNIAFSTWGLGIGDWGLGIGAWGVGPISHAQSPNHEHLIQLTPTPIP